MSSKQSSKRYPCRLNVKAKGSVAFKEGFVDEEDYVKAGSSELLFVQMQQTKSMDKQAKIADKLPPIDVGEAVMDLIVIGCGPAGLSLAAEAAKLGLKVGLIGPDLPFTNNYGVWEDEFKDLGLERCIEHVWQDTIVYLDTNDPILIGRVYGRVSRHLLHEELLKRLATVASGAASGKLLEYEVGGPRVSVQTAYGVEVKVENNPYDPNLMVFMDYRDYMEQKVQCSKEEYPTFLYVMPMSPTRLFFEEWSYIRRCSPATGYSVVRSLSEAPKYASVIAKFLKQDIKVCSQ